MISIYRRITTYSQCMRKENTEVVTTQNYNI
jgi:hypothetical protein